MTGGKWSLGAESEHGGGPQTHFCLSDKNESHTIHIRPRPLRPQPVGVVKVGRRSAVSRQMPPAHIHFLPRPSPRRNSFSAKRSEWESDESSCSSRRKLQVIDADELEDGCGGWI
jgi:hypothetical protein